LVERLLHAGSPQFTAPRDDQACYEPAARGTLWRLAPPPAQTESRLDARIAQAIVDGCAAHAGAKMQSHAIAVVDTGGHLVAALRMDGNSSGMMDFALAKAQGIS